jgi:hypothetical protein
MKTGEKVKTAIPIRSVHTGIFLPREGIVVGEMENLGRSLILVDFGEGKREYLLKNDLQTQE